jgi:pSer/pThr/pTyr-binding forkhead associated (FHA) protein
MYYLQRVTEDKTERFQIELTKKEYTIGRNPNADIKCMSVVCSRRHGTIFVNEDGTIDVVAENVSVISFQFSGSLKTAAFFLL